MFRRRDTRGRNLQRERGLGGMLVGAMVLSLLSACGPKEPYASDDSAKSLLKLVATQPKPGGPYVLEVPEEHESDPGADVGTTTVSVAGTDVLHLSKNHLVLLVFGEPSDEEGASTAAHGSPGNLGAYWFARREGKWFLSASQDSVAWDGSHGNVGDARKVSLGGGKSAVALRSGGCWQGQCMGWLSLYEIHGDHMSELLRRESVEMDSSGAAEGCSELLELPIGTDKAVKSDGPGFSCAEAHTAWSITADKNRPGDLVMRFSGKQIDWQEPTENDAGDEATNTEADAGSDAARTYSVLHARVKGLEPASQVFRYKEGRYVLVKGGNPMASL